MKLQSLSVRLLGIQVCLLGLSAMASQAEFAWSVPNVPGDTTVIYSPFEEELGGQNAKGNLKLIALEDVSNNLTPRNPGIPTLASGPAHLGKALKLEPNNILTGNYGLALTSPGTFTLSFWVQISQPGFLAGVGYSGGHAEDTFGVNLKAMPNGTLRCYGELGKSFEKSEACDIADGTWHHLALVVKPDASGAGSSVQVWLDGNNIIDTTAEGVAPGKCYFALGASLSEFSLERSGLGAEMLIDDLLLENKALEKPNTAHK